jgi:hypothetical protein
MPLAVHTFGVGLPHLSPVESRVCNDGGDPPCNPTPEARKVPEPWFKGLSNTKWDPGGGRLEMGAKDDMSCFPEERHTIVMCQGQGAAPNALRGSSICKMTWGISEL